MDSRVVWQVPFLALVCFNNFVDGKAFLENYGADAYEGNAAVSHWGYSHVLPYSQDGAYSFESSIKNKDQHYQPYVQNKDQYDQPYVQNKDQYDQPYVQNKYQYDQPYVDGSFIFVPPDAQQSFAQTEDSDDNPEFGSIINVQQPFEEATSGQEDDYDYLLEGESLSKKDKTKNSNKSKPKEKNKEMNYSPEIEKKQEEKNVKDKVKTNLYEKGKEKRPQNDQMETDYKSQVVETKIDQYEKEPVTVSKPTDKPNSKDSYDTPFLVDVNEPSEEFDELPNIDLLTKKDATKPPHVKKEKAKPPQKKVKPESIKMNPEYDNEAKQTEKITNHPDPGVKVDNTKTKPQKNYSDSAIIKSDGEDKKYIKQMKDKHGSKQQGDSTDSDLAKKEPGTPKNKETVKMEYDDPTEIQKPFSSLNTNIEGKESEIQSEGNGDRIINNDEKAEIEHVLELLNPGEQSGRFLSALNSNLWSLIFNQNAQLQKFKKCVTRNNETGSCMNLQFCSIPNMASSLEQLLNNACVINDIFIGVCCPDFPVESVMVNWEQSVEVEDNIELSSDVNDCGERSDKAVQVHAWPWKAPLLAKSNGKVFCGGVLISKRYVLTAAHCTTKIPRNQILVRLGEHSSTSGEDVPVMEIKRHAQYNARTMQDDIALLKLARNVKLDDFVDVVCLPEFDDDDDFDHNYEGAVALLLGWRGFRPGQMKENDESLTVMNQTSCKNQLGLAISESILCTDARNENERTCNADSGAPLIVKVEDKYEVLGVLSWNRNDCDPRFPSTFSSVPHYRKWILKHSK